MTAQVVVFVTTLPVSVRASTVTTALSASSKLSSVKHQTVYLHHSNRSLYKECGNFKCGGTLVYILRGSGALLDCLRILIMARVEDSR